MKKDIDARIKLKHLDIHFKQTLIKCEGKDYDCKLFVSMYSNFTDAIEEFYSVDYKNPIIHVAFNDMYNKKFNELKEFEESLIEREMI